ncbi:MAG: hypothetical protein LLG20_18525 [Acidobacteriales bacterium]|nr:hypothetical protein [Terriglobales bacterium]
MTATKNGVTHSVLEMERPDGRAQFLMFAPNGDLTRIHIDPTREDCIAALERDGFTVTE